VSNTPRKKTSLRGLRGAALRHAVSSNDYHLGRQARPAKPKQRTTALDYRLSNGKKLGDYEGKIDPYRFRVAKRCVGLLKRFEQLDKKIGREAIRDRMAALLTDGLNGMVRGR
jgi:hypothetical protein